jgi:hypothetical protein
MSSEFISIGPYCITAEYIRDNGFRTKSYPFDWIFSSIKMVDHCIKDKFKIFLDLSYIYENKHSYYDKMLKTVILEKHSYHVYGTYKDSITYPHDFLHSTFQRRCNRFLDILNSDKKIFLVYTIKYINLDEFYKELKELIIFSKSINVNILVLYINEFEEPLYECYNNLHIHRINNDNFIGDIFNLYK